MNNEVRVNFEVDRDLHARMQGAFPYGFRGPVLRTLVEAVINAVDLHGTMILGAIMAGDFKLEYERKNRAPGKPPI